MARSWGPFAVVAVASFGIWQVLPKLPALAAASPLALALAAVPGLVGATAISGAFKALQAASWHGLAWAAVTGAGGAIATIAVLLAFSRGAQGSMVAPLCALYPIVTALGARVVLGERLTSVQKLGLVLCVAAVVAFAADGGVATGHVGTASWLGYVAVACAVYGASGISMKIASRHAAAPAATAAWAGGFAVVTIVAAVAFAPSVPRSVPFWAWSTVYGALLGAGLWSSFEAYRRGKAAVVTAVTALYPAVTVALAVSLPDVGETLGPRKAMAVALALAAGVALGSERESANNRTNVR